MLHTCHKPASEPKHHIFQFHLFLSAICQKKNPWKLLHISQIFSSFQIISIIDFFFFFFFSGRLQADNQSIRGPKSVEILEEILLNLPPDQVVCVCRLVCRQWKEVADSESLWRERCRRERYRLRDAAKTPDDWRLFYFMCKKRRNLLKNPRAERKESDYFFYWKLGAVTTIIFQPNNQMVSLPFLFYR